MKKLLLVLSLVLITASLWAQTQMLEELNPANLDSDFSNYNTKTALYLGQLSDLSYEDSLTIDLFCIKINARYPGSNHCYKFLEDKDRDVQALLWGTKDFVVVAFRGTEPTQIKDWLTDAHFWNYSNSPDSTTQLAGLPPGHGGFRMSAIRLIDKGFFQEIRMLIEKCNPNIEVPRLPIYLTGHSLGAGIAQLMIAPIIEQKLNYQGSYHFAPPLAVSCSEREKFQLLYGNKVYDIVNYKDYVPRAGRNGVAHFGKFYRICNDNLIYHETEAYVKFSFREWFSEFKLHSLNHLASIRDTSNSLSEITARSIGHGSTPCILLGEEPWNPCTRHN